jgi:uncharacterized protein (DUF1697 family)
MKTFIALFRGINVGGKNSVPMKDLVAVLEELGCCKVRTYIQSGNAVFESAEKDVTQLAKRIGAGVKRRRGFEPSIVVLGVDELENAIKNNPFPEAESDPKALHVGFLASKPKHINLEKLEGMKKESERFRVMAKVFYVHAPEGVGRSRLAAGAEKVLGVPLTDRNWGTVCRLRELAKSLSE